MNPTYFKVYTEPISGTYYESKQSFIIITSNNFIWNDGDIIVDDYFMTIIKRYRKFIINPEEIKRLNKKRLLLGI